MPEVTATLEDGWMIGAVPLDITVAFVNAPDLEELYLTPTATT